MILESTNNIKNHLRLQKLGYMLLSFIVPFFIMLITLAGLKVTPFGDHTLIIADANGLYINTLSYAGRMIKGLEGITYSFEKGLGGNMMGHLNGILLTPFAFLFSLCDILHYPTAYTFISVMNFSLCGLTMYLLLADFYGTKLSNLIFSTTYALIGFNVANVFQAVFFCAAPVLPFMVIGLRRILQRRSPLIYILSIAYGLITNAYFGFVLCVASVLFLAAELYASGNKMEEKKGRVFLNYAVSSLCGGSLACVLWLPGFLSLRGGRLDQTTLSEFYFRENMPLLEVGSKLFTGANSTSELINGLPNIFVGLLPVALSILFFLNKKNDRKKKVAAGFLISIYLLSFYIVAFNMMMHGGTTTNWFNYRYSYVFSFILLMIAAQEWQHISNISSSDLKKCITIMLVATIIVFSRRYEFVMAGEVLLDYAILMLMFLAFTMFQKDPVKNPEKTFVLVILVLTSMHLMLNYGISTYNVMKEEGWMHPVSEYVEVVEKVDPIIETIKKTDTGFYRMEVNEQRSETCGNDPMLYGYNGVGHGGSNERDFVRIGLNKIGIPWFDMRNYYAEGVPAATDTLLGLKYLVAKEDITEEKGYQKMTDHEDWNLYYNPNSLPVAFISAQKIENTTIDFEDVFENLNQTWNAVSGMEEQVFLEEDDIIFSSHNYSEPIDLTAEDARAIVARNDTETTLSGITSAQQKKTGVLKEKPEDSAYIQYTWTAKKDGPVYSYNRSGLLDTSGSFTSVLNYEGYYYEGESVTGYIPVYSDTVTRSIMEDVSGRFRAAYAAEETLAKLSRIVRERPATAEKIRENHLIGEFTADENQKLMFTIPYDEGWILTVDGKKVELKEVLGVLMAADVESGTHQYEMKYTPAGLRTGMIISGLALAATVIWIVICARQRRKDQLLEKEVLNDTI